jgi:hypothetical protein
MGAQGGTPSEPAATETRRVLDRVQLSSDASAEHFQAATAAVDFSTAPVSHASLRVELESPCFPFEGWSEQGVASGQRWPDACDAFDRGLSVSLDAASADGVGLELLRAVTPFGGPLLLEEDVTDVVNGLPGAHQLRIQIDTWPDPEGRVSGAHGSWIASVELELTPGAAPRRVLAVLPLVNESQTEPDAAPVDFEVPPGAASARIEYRVTGHGGAPVRDPRCVGPAEEFCERTHELRLDGELLDELRPWRDDCQTLCTPASNTAELGPAQYCAENPCGDPNSVRAPRANWCPGSKTPPFRLEAAALSAAGSHRLERSILELKAGGSWRVSASYFAFE